MEKRIYQIVGWNEFYENNKSREREACSWVALPVKHDGLGYKRIFHHPDCAEIFTAHVLMVECCMKQGRPRCGLLTDKGLPGGNPWDAEDLAIMTNAPVEIFEKALPLLCDPKIGWYQDVTEMIVNQSYDGIWALAGRFGDMPWAPDGHLAGTWRAHKGQVKGNPLLIEEKRREEKRKEENSAGAREGAEGVPGHEPTPRDLPRQQWDFPVNDEAVAILLHCSFGDHNLGKIKAIAAEYYDRRCGSEWNGVRNWQADARAYFRMVKNDKRFAGFGENEGSEGGDEFETVIVCKKCFCGEDSCECISEDMAAFRKNNLVNMRKPKGLSMDRFCGELKEASGK